MNNRLVILLAEDNPGDVALVREALEVNGLSVDLYVAANGREVTALLQRIGVDVPRPDAVLLDLNIPGVESSEMFRQVRAHPLCAEVPIVVVTSSDSPRDRAWTKEWGVSEYFRKPTDYDEFMRLGKVVGYAAQSTGRS